MREEGLKSKRWLKYIEGQECVVASILPNLPRPQQRDHYCSGDIVAHHLGHSYYKGYLKRKLDYATVPICFKHHRELHDMGRPSFENFYGIDFKAILVDILIDAVKEFYGTDR